MEVTWCTFDGQMASSSTPQHPPIREELLGGGGVQRQPRARRPTSAMRSDVLLANRGPRSAPRQSTSVSGGGRFQMVSDCMLDEAPLQPHGGGGGGVRVRPLELIAQLDTLGEEDEDEVSLPGRVLAAAGNALRRLSSTLGMRRGSATV